MQRRGARVLAINGSAEYLSLLRALVAAEGYHVETAQSAGAARTLLDFFQPQVVVTESRVPGIPPSQVYGMLYLIDANEKTRGISVVLCARDAQEIEEAGELTRPRAQVLLQPYDIDDILACIARALRAAD